MCIFKFLRSRNKTTLFKVCLIAVPTQIYFLLIQYFGYMKPDKFLHLNISMTLSQHSPLLYEKYNVAEKLSV